jgi:hypothetical protein
MTEMTLTHDAGAPAEATGGFPESTLSFKLDVQGLQLTWTLRGSDASMAHRLPRVLAYLGKLQQRLPQAEAPPPAAPRPAPPAPVEERDDYCPIHGVAMVQQSNERGSWWSHRLPEGGYCKGKRRKAGA